jgi:hypothetical protein
MLLSMFAITQPARLPSSSTGRRPGLCDQHSPTSVVGTTATTGASMPAAFSVASSHAVLPLITIRHNPTAMSTPTNTARAGV